MDRLLEQKHALEKTEDILRTVIELLDELPLKSRHSVMVPLGPMAFFKGDIVHTNECLQRLSEQYIVKRSCATARASLQRRLSSATAQVANAKSTIAVFEERGKLLQSEQREAPADQGSRVRQMEGGVAEIIEYEDDGGGGGQHRPPSLDAAPAQAKAPACVDPGAPPPPRISKFKAERNALRKAAS
eukprot:Polyplicarium_translucidae@DN2408_c0_g2_i1.p1